MSQQSSHGASFYSSYATLADLTFEGLPAEIKLHILELLPGLPTLRLLVIASRPFHEIAKHFCSRLRAIYNRDLPSIEAFEQQARISGLPETDVKIVARYNYKHLWYRHWSEEQLGDWAPEVTEAFFKGTKPQTRRRSYQLMTNLACLDYHQLRLQGREATDRGATSPSASGAWICGPFRLGLTLEEEATRLKYLSNRIFYLTGHKIDVRSVQVHGDLCVRPLQDRVAQGCLIEGDMELMEALEGTEPLPPVSHRTDVSSVSCTKAEQGLLASFSTSQVYNWVVGNKFDPSPNRARLVKGDWWLEQAVRWG